MNLGELIASGSGIAVVLLSMIQISPFKFNPWSKIAKLIGKAINAEVLNELETVKKTQEATKKQLEERVKVEDERNADSMREKILHFNVELMRNIPHTREDFIEILATIDNYEQYCKNNPGYKNNRAFHAVANIERVYDKRLEKNDFYLYKESENKK